MQRGRGIWTDLKYGDSEAVIFAYIKGINEHLIPAL